MRLSERQQDAVATAITILAAVVILAAIGGVFWSLAVFFRTFSAVFLPLAVAGIAALVAQPYFDWLRTRLHLRTPVALVALLLSVLLPVALFLAFFGTMLTRQVVSLIPELVSWWEQLPDRLDEHWPEIRAFFEETELGRQMNEALRSQRGNLLAGLGLFSGKAVAAGADLVHWMAGGLGWMVTPVYFVFFLLGKRDLLADLEDYLPFLKPETRQDVAFLVREFVNIVVTFFRGQLVVAFLQGLLFAAGFSLVGLKYGLILGLLLGLLNIVPYLGSMVGLAVTLPLSYFQADGGVSTLLAVILVYGIVQTIEGYFLTPRIMGERTGLHPMVIIVAVFFWGSALNGILGMILAIPLTAFLVVLWRLAKQKYIAEWV
jgi:predicted PurR-regulated permease PerM